MMRKSRFGKAPSGARLEQIKKSSNYKDGKFQNYSLTPALAEGYSMRGVVYTQFFKKVPGRIPAEKIPSVKSDLLHLPANDDILVWFGHSSYFIQIDGRRILVDPVFSGNASPLYGTNRSFKGADVFTVDDLPPVDYLFISHDHYDHLDFETIMKLKSRTGKVICGLGVGSHLEYWGFDPSKIIERDWNDKVELDNDITAYVTPARHFSGRGFSRNNTLWCSFLLQTSTLKIYIGGDSGYDKHFADIGSRFGPVDIAILDNGQYNAAWHYIHMLPEEVLQAAKDLGAKRLLPVHSSKFAMANHAWNDPLVRITALNEKFHIPLVTPMIGEPVCLKDDSQQFKQWWIDLK